MRVTKYMPIVTVEHADDGAVTGVEIDWSDALAYIEQTLELEEAEELAKHFDQWLQEHPAHVSPGHHWEFEA